MSYSFPQYSGICLQPSRFLGNKVLFFSCSICSTGSFFMFCSFGTADWFFVISLLLVFIPSPTPVKAARWSSLSLLGKPVQWLSLCCPFTHDFPPMTSSGDLSALENKKHLKPQSQCLATTSLGRMFTSWSKTSFRREDYLNKARTQTPRSPGMRKDSNFLVLIFKEFGKSSAFLRKLLITSKQQT